MTKEDSSGSKKRSKIIVEVANGSKNLTDALFELKILLSDLGNTEIVAWIDSELSGYKDNNVPKYREFNGVLCGNVLQVGGGGLLKRQMVIPVKVDKLEYTKCRLKDNITAIAGYENKEEKGEISMPVDMRIANLIADLELNELCQINNAWFKIPLSKYTDILNAVKSRVLDILLMLEKKYGNLDSYTIDFGKGEERDEISQIVINIIYNDNGISMGDNNKISKSKVGGSDGS